MPTIHVWLATNAFLYLPIYALADLGILKRVGGELRRPDINIRIATPKDKGDRKCIEHMLAEAKKNQDPDVLHIAVADPLAAFAADPDGKEVRTVGAFIKRPAFWVVGREAPANPHLKHKVVCYNQSLATGNFLGREYARVLDDDDPECRPLGQEIDLLFDPAYETFTGRLRVVTADIIGVVRATMIDSDIQILETLSDRREEFVTTGIITHRKCTDESHELLSIFMEALRTSCILMHTAEAPAAALIGQLSAKKEFQDQLRVFPAGAGDFAPSLSADEARGVAHRIFASKLYQGRLRITHAEWRGSVDARLWDRPKDRHRAMSHFNKTYEGRPVLAKMEAWLAKSMGDYSDIAKRARSAETTLIGMFGILLAMQAAQMVQANAGAVGWWLRLYNLLGAGALLLGCYWALSPVVARVAERWSMFYRITGADLASKRSEVTQNIVIFCLMLLVWWLALPSKGESMSLHELVVSLTPYVTMIVVISLSMLSHGRR